MALKDIRLKSAPPTTSGEQLFFLARSDTESATMTQLDGPRHSLLIRRDVKRNVR